MNKIKSTAIAVGIFLGADVAVYFVCRFVMHLDNNISSIVSVSFAAVLMSAVYLPGGTK